MLIDRLKAAADGDYRAEMRKRCQEDLLFLGRVLGYNRIVDEVHEPVALLCVLKDPSKSIEEQNPIKQRLHLDPRGSFKSTLSIIDSVQWIICFPDVRICKLTATKPLAKAIAGEIADHFVKAKDAEPSDFQLLFPEYVISPKDKLEGEYTAPCRTRKWREATVMAFSIETSISGWHFDVFDPDDVVDNQNSTTPQGIAKVKRNYRINKKTLMPWGYVNFKGTRYDNADLWGDIIDKAKPGKIKTLVRAALRVNSGKRLERDEFPDEKDVTLLFPQLLSYEFLKGEFEEDYESFMSQYMNDAHGGREVIFPKELLLQQTVPAGELPYVGELFVAWRFAYKGKAQMQFNGAAAGILAEGRMWVTDLVRGKFTPSALAHRVVQLAQKIGVNKVTIEATPGSMTFAAAINNYAISMGCALNIHWAEYIDDDAVRDLRMKQLEPLLVSRRLVFSDGMKFLKDLYAQFCNFGMSEDTELVDVVARLAEQLPQSISVDLDAQQNAAWDLARQRDLHDRTYGLGEYGMAVAVVEEPYKPPTNDYGLPDILGGCNG